MNSVLASQGKDTVNTFTPVTSIKMTKTPGLMTELIRWVLNKSLDNKNKPTLNVTANWNWTEDFHRHHLEYYYDTLDCSYQASVDLSHAATDGAQIGATRWAFKGVLVGIQNNNPLPGKFALDQNYPNPFNPSTTIEYSVAKGGHVTLEVFNVLGQSVARLVDAVQTVGTYKISFDASKLSSGVYLYQIKAGDFIQARKMVLLK